MNVSKSVIALVVALVVSSAITAFFVVDLSGHQSGPLSTTQLEGGYLPAPSPESFSTNGTPPAAASNFPQFEEVSEEVGIEYQSVYTGNGFMSSSGVYVADVDNDGLEDLLLLGGDQPVLFENTGGQFTRTREFNLESARTAHFFDHDQDGDRDLLFAEYGGRLKYYENEGGEFQRKDVGLDHKTSNPITITTADFDGNGCQDVFVGQYGKWQSGPPMTRQDLKKVYENHPSIRPKTRDTPRNILLYGDCETFTDVSRETGVRGANWTLAASATDINNDGYPDLHVGNDFSADQLYINDGTGHFEQRIMGPSTDRNAMSSRMIDTTGDHLPELFVSNIYIPEDAELRKGSKAWMWSPVPEGNNYFVNTGNGAFEDRAKSHGLQKGGWAWAGVPADFNNDGHLDLVHTTSSKLPVRNYGDYRDIQIWRGSQDSWTDVDADQHGFEQHNGRALVRTDFDQDGDLDLVVSTTASRFTGGGNAGNGTPFYVYENQANNGDQALQLWVRNPGNTTRIAAVYIETDQRTILRRVNSRGNFLSQDSRLIHVGLANEDLEQVTVVWPSGKSTEYNSLTTGNRYIVTPDSVEEVTTNGNN